MRLLMLGGTEFVGRAVVEAALARGWDVTVFHRGRHEPPAGVRSLHGDRTSPDGLAALAGTEEEWDVVVDTWSAAPRVVRDSARLLADRARRYVYVSSCSVYAWPPAAGYDEDSPVVEGASADAEQTDYARDKRGGELAVLEAFGKERALLVRAGLILGPYENIGRLPWWLDRMARGGPVLAPGPRELPCSTSMSAIWPSGPSGRWRRARRARTTSSARRGTRPWGRCSTRASRSREVRLRKVRPSSGGPIPRWFSRPGSSRGSSCRCGCRPARSRTTRCTGPMCPGR